MIDMDFIKKRDIDLEVMSVLRTFAGVPGLNASGSTELQALPDGRLLLRTCNWGWQTIAVKIMGKVYTLPGSSSPRFVGSLVSADNVYAYLSRDLGVDYYNSGYTELTDENVEQLRFTIALKGI